MSNSKTGKEKNPQLEEKNKKKGWFFYIHQFNDNLAQLVSFNTKLLMFVLLVFFVYLILASILQGETFSVNQLNVHHTIEEKGYNSTFIAKKISYDISSIVNEVPLKLVAMFSAGRNIEKNNVLYERILDKYTKKEIKIDMEVNVGGYNIPLRQLTKTARSIFNVENKSLDGDLTVEDDLLIMTLGLNADGINKGYQSNKYNYNPNDTVRMFDIIETVTRDAARFVLSKYDPLVTLLIDYNPISVYSNSDTVWRHRVYTEPERLQILKDLYLNDNKDYELAIWSHAITGAIYFDKYDRIEDPDDLAHSIQHFLTTIEMDPSFVDIVGNDLAKNYLNLNDPESVSKGINIYEKMIKSDPSNIDIHIELLRIYARQENSFAYYKVLSSAFKHGLYLSDRDMKRSHYKAYKDQDEFNTLLEKYNETNKQRIDTWLLDKILKFNSSRIGNSEQIILVTNQHRKETEVTVEIFEKKDNKWVEVLDLMEGAIGRNGFAPYLKKVEGDGKTPTGIFFLGPVFSYPGVKVTTKMKYWTASENDYWIDDVNSDLYNRWVTSDTDPKNYNISREEMKRADELYKYGVAVKYNMDQGKNKDQKKGMGSVIVFHVKESDKPTAGCVKVPETDIIDVIGWLDPEKKPLIIMGTKDELATKIVSANELSENDNYIWKKEKWIPPTN